MATIAHVGADDFGDNPGGFDTYAEFREAQEAAGTEGKTLNDLYRGEEFVTRLTDSDFDERVKDKNTGNACADNNPTCSPNIDFVW